jgi:DNA polymerase-3 subunit delta'
MAAKDDEILDDRAAGAPPPRERVELFGHKEPETAFLDAIRSGRLHHAWLLGGPVGIGKATLAFRVARFLLAHGGSVPAGATSLHVKASHPAARQVAARSHPNLVVLNRFETFDRKTPGATIRVDAVRRVAGLFTATAADGGYRICVIDSADDLAPPSANALLKLLEEPPARSLFLIVSHMPGRLLPTIRSRCRALAMNPLRDDDIAAAVRSLGPSWSDLDEAALAEPIRFAEGSVRRALEMLDPDALAIAASTSQLLDELPSLDLKRVLALAETVTRKEPEGGVRLALDLVFAWVSRWLEARAKAGPARLAPFVEVCEKAARSAREAEIYNLDRRPVILAAFGDLAEAVRRAA